MMNKASTIIALMLITIGCRAEELDKKAIWENERITLPTMTNYVWGVIAHADVVNYSAAERVEPTTASEELVTNSWTQCISNYDRGLKQICAPEYAYMVGQFNDYVFAATNSACIIGDVRMGSFDGHMFAISCNKEHIDDYPKVQKLYRGVQKRITYKKTIFIAGDEIETTWEKYTYPHQKLTKTITVKIVKDVVVDEAVEETFRK